MAPTSSQVRPSAKRRRMWARNRTSGVGSLRYRSSNAWRCRASRVTLRVMGASTGEEERGCSLHCTGPVYFPSCVDLFRRFSLLFTPEQFQFVSTPGEADTHALMQE